MTDHQSPLTKAKRRSKVHTYDAVFNAVCDCEAFMAAFGSDISSERCHKLIKSKYRVGRSRGIHNSIFVRGSQSFSVFHFSTVQERCARTAHLGGDKDRCSFLYVSYSTIHTYEIIKSRPTTLTHMYVHT